MIAALVPAAGRSGRMGRPKLILPIGGIPLIARVVGAFREGGTARVVVVVAPGDQPGAREIAEAAEGRGAEVVVAATSPPDMRASVEIGLAALMKGPQPSAILLAPGDSPGLDASLVARTIRVADGAPGRIVVPYHEGRRGHPILIPWELAMRIPGLPPGVGVNALLRARPDEIEAFDAGDPGVLFDLDTPEDYRRWDDPAG